MATDGSSRRTTGPRGRGSASGEASPRATAVRHGAAGIGEAFGDELGVGVVAERFDEDLHGDDVLVRGVDQVRAGLGSEGGVDAGHFEQECAGAVVGGRAEGGCGEAVAAGEQVEVSFGEMFYGFCGGLGERAEDQQCAVAALGVDIARSSAHLLISSQDAVVKGFADYGGVFEELGETGVGVAAGEQGCEFVAVH